MGLKATVPDSAGVRRRWRRFNSNLAVGAIIAVALVVSATSLALATDGPSGFPDVPPGHPYADAIHDLSGRGIINGYTDGNFGPENPVTRQQFTKMVVGTAGYPVSEADVCLFADVAVGGPTTFYPDNFVAVCAARGITLGKTPTTFHPHAHITRYQVISMVVRAADDLSPGLLSSPPPGWMAIVGWSEDPTHGANAVRAEYNGLLDGLDLGALNPYEDMSRGEVAQVLHNLLVLLGSPPATSSSTTTSAPTTSSSTTSTTDAPQPAGHDLIYCWWTAAGGWKSHNVSQTTGRQLISPVAYWADSHDSAIEHLAGMAPNNDLVLFWAHEHQNNWQTVNVTSKTGQKIAHPPTAWVEKWTGQFYRDNLAAVNEDGDVINFYWSLDHDWQATNITEVSHGPEMTGELESWTEYSPVAQKWIDRVAGRSTANDLIVFWTGARQNTWQAVNVSNITGQKIGGPVTYWWTDYDPGPGDQHLACRSPSGELLVFWWSEDHDWQVVNVTQAIGGQKIADQVTSFGANLAENIAGMAASGDLLHFWYTWTEPVRKWRLENLSQLTGRKIDGPATFYLTWDHLNQRHIEHLVATTPAHQPIIFVGTSMAHTWSAVQPAGLPKMQGKLTSWETNDAQGVIDHFAGLKYE